jgi:hypothetical protein
LQKKRETPTVKEKEHLLNHRRRALMQVQVSLKIEIAATASLTEMEQQIQEAGQAAMREAMKNHQAMGGSAQDVPTLRPATAKIGRNGASGHRYRLWTGAGSATTFSLPGVSPALVSSQRFVRRVEGRNDQYTPTRGGDASRMFLALSCGE